MADIWIYFNHHPSKKGWKNPSAPRSLVSISLRDWWVYPISGGFNQNLEKYSSPATTQNNSSSTTPRDYVAVLRNLVTATVVGRQPWAPEICGVWCTKQPLGGQLCTTCTLAKNMMCLGENRLKTRVLTVLTGHDLFQNLGKPGKSQIKCCSCSPKMRLFGSPNHEKSAHQAPAQRAQTMVCWFLNSTATNHGGSDWLAKRCVFHTEDYWYLLQWIN